MGTPTCPDLNPPSAKPLYGDLTNYTVTNYNSENSIELQKHIEVNYLAIYVSASTNKAMCLFSEIVVGEIIAKSPHESSQEPTALRSVRALAQTRLRCV